MNKKYVQIKAMKGGARQYSEVRKGWGQGVLGGRVVMPLCPLPSVCEGKTFSGGILEVSIHHYFV